MNDERPPCKCHGSWPLHADDQATALRKLGLENDRLESQNQALQEEVEDKAAVLTAIAALLDVDDEHTGWDRIVALRKRAEKAEALLRECLDAYDDSGPGDGSAYFDWPAYAERVRAALSPTQETDPE
jgi:hypothetical protein